jgi:DNA-binding GntR family transcriptional regulator
VASGRTRPVAPDQPSSSVGARLDTVIAGMATGYRSVGDFVYDVLRGAIVDGVFASGEHLRQEEVAAAIGVSRFPVRLALIKLDSEGLVVFHPRRGAVVTGLTKRQVEEIYNLRELLEAFALRQSLQRMTPERIALLRSEAERLDAETEIEAFLELRTQFYRQLYDDVENPRLVAMIEDLRASLARYLVDLRVSGPPTHRSSHHELVELIDRADAAGAEQWLVNHLREVRHDDDSPVPEVEGTGVRAEATARASKRPVRPAPRRR